VLLRFIIFQRFFILHFHVFSVTRCHHSCNELASFGFFVFVRHTTHCFLLLVCYMFCGWKHCPEEAHLNRWAKRWLIIKYNRQKSLFISLFDLKLGGKRYETTWVAKRTAVYSMSKVGKSRYGAAVGGCSERFESRGQPVRSGWVSWNHRLVSFTSQNNSGVTLATVVGQIFHC